MRFPEEVMWALTGRYVNVHNLFIYTIMAVAALRKFGSKIRGICFISRSFSNFRTTSIYLKPKLYNIKLLMSVYLQAIALLLSWSFQHSSPFLS